MNTTTPLVPDVWSERSTGTPWCDCGDDCTLDEETVEDYAEDLFGQLPDRLTHRQVVALAAAVWRYVEVCRFFTLAVEAAATRVADAPRPDYPLTVGTAIVRAFCNAWNGCPDELCRGGDDLSDVPRTNDSH